MTVNYHILVIESRVGGKNRVEDPSRNSSGRGWNVNCVSGKQWKAECVEGVACVII